MTRSPLPPGRPDSPADGRGLLWALAFAFAHGLSAADTAALAQRFAPDERVWPAFARLAKSHRCETLAYHLLTAPEVRAACGPPDEVVAALRQRYMSAFVRGTMEPAFVGRLVAELDAAGVPALVVKGLAVGAWLYPDPVLREHLDIDLLAPEHAALTVGRVLGELGFTPAYQPPLYPGERPATIDYGHADGGWHVDLGYDPLRLFWPPVEAAAASFAGWWQRRQAVVVGGTTLPTLGPEDQFIHLARHLQFHDYFRVNSFLDVLLLLRLHGDQIDWSLVGREARAADIQGGLFRTLELAERVWGMAAPEAAWRELRPGWAIRTLHRRIWEEDLAAVRDHAQAAGRPIIPRFLSPGGPHPVTGFALHVLGRHPGRTVGYLVRRVVPPASWLRATYGSANSPQPSYWSLVCRHWRALLDVRRQVRASGPPSATDA